MNLESKFKMNNLTNNKFGAVCVKIKPIVHLDY